MIHLLQLLLRSLQPFLVPLCFLLTWVFIISLAWSVWSVIRDTVARSRQMHQIPCAQCQFFTQNYHLKCTVHPTAALTEAAIDCPDFTPPTGAYPKPIGNSHP